MASAITTPLACPTDMAVRTLVWKKTRSTATTTGWVWSSNERISRCSSAKRSGSGDDAGVVITPADTARARPAANGSSTP